MTRVEHDPSTYHLVYAGWALPGTATSAAGWRIVKFVWSGNVLDHYEWADGDDLLDNVWDDRASLTYVENDNLSIEAAGRVDVAVAGSLPGTNFVAPVDLDDATYELMLDSSPMRPITSGSPVGNQVLVSGTALQTGTTITSTAWFFLRVWL